MMYRARIVFNGPLDREHIVYSTAKSTAGEVMQMLTDLAPVLPHAVSVKPQRTEDGAGRTGWHDISALAAWEDWDGPSEDVLA